MSYYGAIGGLLTTKRALWLSFKNYLLYCFTFVFACEKLSQRYFISLVDQLVGSTLNPSFYRVLAFARLIFVLVKNYQVKFRLTVTNHLKSIL